MPKTGTQESESWTPLLILVVALVLLYLLFNVLLVFILAALFAFIVHPLVDLLNKRLPRLLSIIILYLSLAIALSAVIGVLVPVVTQQFREFVITLPAYIEQARNLFDIVQQRYGALPDRWRDVTDSALVDLQQTAIRITRESIPAVLALFAGLVTLIFVPLLAFFMLLDVSGYKQMLIAIIPRRHRSTVEDLLTCASRGLWNFVKGELILMLAVGMATGLGLYLVGMPYAIVFGILAGLLEVVPNIGPTISTIFVGLIGLLIDPFLGLKAASLMIVIQLLENAFLAPVVMSRAVGLDPVTIIFSIFLGGSVAGILGALIAIPLAITIKIVILYFYARDHDLPNGSAVCRSGDTGRKQTRARRR